MSNTWRGGSTRRWRKLRETVLARDGHACQVRVIGKCTGRATQVHHTQGKAQTGDDPRYLVAACRPCNLAVGEPSKHDPKPRPITRW